MHHRRAPSLDTLAILEMPKAHMEAVEKRQADQQLYSLIHEKVTHILENKRLSRGEQADRIADLFVKQLKSRNES